MSERGVQLAASVFAAMQNARIELLSFNLGETMATAEAKQDILLAHMLEAGKDAMKDRFCAIVAMNTKDAV